jgi:hypothetical protein
MSKAISSGIGRAFVLLLAAVLLTHCGPSGQPKPTAAPPKPARLGGPEVEKRVDAILAKMSLEEKIDYIGGVDSFYVREIPRLGVPRLKMADGPFGVRASGFSTTLPAGINLAASWDPAVGEHVGTEIDLDARAFSFWDTASHQWRANPGSYEILIGESSANTPLKSTVTVK